MQRILIFSLSFAVVGAMFPLICVVQGMSPLIPIRVMSTPLSGNQMADTLRDVFLGSYPVGAPIGAFVGCALTLWDVIRNRRDATAARRLAANLAWCLFYAALLLGFNGAIIATISFFHYAPQKLRPPEPFIFIPILSVPVINLTAILWAAIRSITTDDVLTPRVLREKLRERARLG